MSDTPLFGRVRRFTRRLIYLALLVVIALVGGLTWFAANMELPEAVALSESSIIYDRNGQIIAELRAEEDRFYVALDEISPVLIDAVIATEDRDFRSHPGVDPVAIARALWVDLRKRELNQGGSTITQQYVKNAFLGRERTASRKIREAALAIRLEREMGKDEILERYLNTIYFGRGAYGVEAAARAYFGSGVSAADLDLPRASYLAGLIRAPETADVSRPDQADEAARRRRTVLVAMAEEGYITSEQRDAVEAVPLETYVTERNTGDTVRLSSRAQGLGVEYFVEHVRQEVTEILGEPGVFGRGLRINTTLDLDMQAAGVNAVERYLDVEGAPAGSLVTLDDEGGIRAMVGGLDWEESQVNLATGTDGGGGGRQSGSSFKALVLAAASEEGVSMRSRFLDPGSMVFPGANDGADWTVGNYSSGDRGVSDLVSATAASSNTVFAQLVLEVGPGRVAELSTAMGVEADLRAIPSIALGTQEVSVLDMATAYSSLMNRGVLRGRDAVASITSADGSVEWNRSTGEQRVLSTQSADVVTATLQNAVDTGTGRRARVSGTDVAGKTGTTQNAADAWFVGYTPKYTTAVWVGFADSARPMRGLLGYDEITGSGIPSLIFSAYMSRVPDPGGGASFAGDAGYPGEVLGAALVDPVQTTPEADVTTTVPESTTTTVPESTTTLAPDATSTTAAPDTAPPTTAAPAPTTTAVPETQPPTTTAVPDTQPPTTTAPPATTAAPDSNTDSDTDGG